MADNTPLNDSCRTEGAPIAASTNPANKGLRTDGRVRFAPPPVAEAQGVSRTQQRSDGGMGPEHPPGFLERPAVASTRET